MVEGKSSIRLPIVARSHQISRRSQDILDAALNPWPTIFFPEQSDYGIDGDVKLTEEGVLAPPLRPYTFQFQLKATESKQNGTPSVIVKTSHLLLWLCHNIPIVLFFVIVGDGEQVIYWRCMDKMFLQWLESKNQKWTEAKTHSISFDENDLLTSDTRRLLVSSTENWERPLDPSVLEGEK